MSERLTINGYDYHVPPNVKAEVEHLRGELAEIDARVEGARGVHRRNWKAEAENEHLRALLDPDNDEQVKQMARAMARARERNARWRDLSGWKRDCADVRAVLTALRKGGNR